MDYQKFLSQAIDLHVHIGPEPLPRKYTAESLARAEKGKLGGLGLKSHFFPTTPFIKELKVVPKKLRLIGSVTLNNYVGGLNPEVVRSTAKLVEEPIIVWFPTINAQNFLEKSQYEIQPEWVKGTSFKPRLSNEFQGISVLKSGKLTKETIAVLKTVKEVGAMLATGHLSWQEAEKLVECGIEMEIEKIIVTHPIYQLIDMPVEVQLKLAQLGAFIEVCYSMYSIDKVPIGKIAKQIRKLGPENCILSSDVGQVFSKSPSESLAEFMKLLEKEGFSKENLYLMLVKNPLEVLKTKR